jgi:hypothetical protein
MRMNPVSRGGDHLPLLLALACAILLTAGAARANIVQNPGFETGDFSDWTVTGNGIAIDTVFPNTGCCDAVFSAASTDPTPGVLSQTLATMPGQGYQLGFALLDEAGFTGDTFTVDFGGFSTTITGDMAAPPGNLPSFYTDFSFAVPGADITGTSTILSFEGLNFPGIGIDWNLDDVSVTVAPTAIPEPATAPLLLVALALGLCLARPRRRY